MINSRSRTLGLIALGLLLAALVFRSGGLVWLSMPFLSYLGIGLFRAPSPEDLRFVARRSCQEIGRGEVSLVEVVARLENRSSRTLYVSVADPPLRGARIVEGELERSFHLRPGEEARLRYLFEARRGSFGWDSLLARVSDPFGLFETETRLKAEARVLIQPHFTSLPSIPLRLERTLASPGSIPIRMGGAGTDFWGIREFQRGDPLKRLYWRLFARNPLKRYAKEYVQEKTAEVILVLDGRQRMDLAVGEVRLFERELEAVASMAAMLVKQGQRVGLSIIGGQPRNVLPDYGRIQLRRILRCLAEAEPEREEGRDALYYLPGLRCSRSAFWVLVSPLGEDGEYVFRRMRALGYRALLLCPDSLDFARPAIADDALTGLALRACRIERALSLGRIARLSFTVVDWRLDRDLAGILESALTRRYTR